MATSCRVSVTCDLNYYRPEALAFNHDYTWTVLIYGFIFWLWYLWTESLSQAANKGWWMTDDSEVHAFAMQKAWWLLVVAAMVAFRICQEDV